MPILRYEHELPNSVATTFANADVVGQGWQVNFSGVGGALTAAAVAGGGFDLAVGVGEDGIVEIVGPLQTILSVGGPAVFEADIEVVTDASNAAAVFVGFTDRKNAVEEIPIQNENGTLVTAATDAVGMMLEREQDATWTAVSVTGDADGAKTPLTDLPDVVTGTNQRLRVEVQRATGDTKFFIDGKQASHTRSAAVSTAVALAPVITLDARNFAVLVRVRHPRGFGIGGA